MKLPAFTGKQGELLQSFPNKVENGARLGCWTPEYKRGQLYAQITGGALQYVDTLPPEETGDYDSLCAALRRRYEGDLEKEKCREALRTCRRGRSESLDDLAWQIRELTRKAYPADRREEEGIYALRNAVSDSLADHIVVQNYGTMDEAVMALSRLECHKDHRNRTRQARLLHQEEPGTSEVTPGGVPKKAVPTVQPVCAIKDHPNYKEGIKEAICFRLSD